MSHATVLVAFDNKPDDIESAVAEQMAPFDENGTMFSDGSRWDWFSIGGRWKGQLCEGDIMQVKDIHPNKFQARRIKTAKAQWKEMQGHAKNIWPVIFNESEQCTEEHLINNAKRAWFPSHYAFLRLHQWHERQRMGWFGCEAKTECEMKTGEAKFHRCKTKSKGAPEAYIVTWGEEVATWDFKFYDRFIKPLPANATLVTVDYHV